MQDKRKLAIEVDNVQKIYKLYDKPSDRLKEAFGFGKKTKHKLHYALKGVSMKIYQGETVGIIGTNGSGKSTILKIITGVLNPTSGRVLVNGRISALLELGAGFNMEYNGIENVYLNGTMMGFPKRDRGKTAGDLKLCGYRRLCLSAGKDLFQRYVRPPGVCSGDQYRAGDPDRR